VDADREAQLLDHLRLADKMMEYIYQLSQMKSELDKATVRSSALRAKAALREAMKTLEKRTSGDAPSAVS